MSISGASAFPPEIVRDNMGHVECRRDPCCSQQEAQRENPQPIGKSNSAGPGLDSANRNQGSNVVYNIFRFGL